MGNEIELGAIWWEEPDGGSYTVGKNAQRIFIIQDGNGVSGQYDRIHVLGRDAHMIFPAHQVGGWSLAETKAALATEKEEG